MQSRKATSSNAIAIYAIYAICAIHAIYAIYAVVMHPLHCILGTFVQLLYKDMIVRDLVGVCMA